MRFSFELLKQKVPAILTSKDEKACFGRVKIGEFEERFLMSLGYWEKLDYQNQWHKAAVRMIEGGHQTTAFVTDIHDPQTMNFMTWWIVFRKNEKLYVQNHLCFMDQLSEKFSVERLYDYIPSRRTVSDEGDEVSEWEMSVSDMKEYYRIFTN